MITSRSVDFSIGFADSRIISYESVPDGLVLFLLAWNEEILKFYFTEPLFFSILCTDDVSDVRECHCSDSSKRAMEYLLTPKEKQEDYKSLSFINLNGDPSIEICCRNYKIEIHHENSNFCRLCGLYQEDPPWGNDGLSPTFKTCPCCGIQFGTRDKFFSQVKELRNEWIEAGYGWIDNRKMPINWSPASQMANIPQSFI